MADDTQQANEVPEIETQDSPVPSEEQKTDIAAEENNDTAEVETKLPDEAKERTKREFDKLQSNLREERARREYYEQLFSQVPQQQTPIIDPDTGFPSEQGLSQIQREAAEAKQRAERAERAIQNMENQQVYQAYPELNPEGESFNQELHDLTRSIALDSMVNPDSHGGKQLTFKDAADKAKNILGKQADVIKKQTTEEVTEQFTSKEQASLDAGGSGRQPNEPDLATLRQVSRGNTEEAKMARIARFEKMQGKS